MKIASVAKVRSQFNEYVKASEAGPIVERLVMAYSPRLRAILDRSRQQIQEGRGISHEEFWAEFDVPTTPKARGRAKGKSA